MAARKTTTKTETNKSDGRHRSWLSYSYTGEKSKLSIEITVSHVKNIVQAFKRAGKIAGGIAVTAAGVTYSAGIHAKPADTTHAAPCAITIAAPPTQSTNITVVNANGAETVYVVNGLVSISKSQQPQKPHTKTAPTAALKQ